jgi:hypothetical protein
VIIPQRFGGVRDNPIMGRKLAGPLFEAYCAINDAKRTHPVLISIAILKKCASYNFDKQVFRPGNPH